MVNGTRRPKKKENGEWSKTTFRKLDSVDAGIAKMVAIWSNIMRRRGDPIIGIDGTCGDGSEPGTLHSLIRTLEESHRRYKVYGCDIDRETAQAAQRRFPPAQYPNVQLWHEDNFAMVKRLFFEGTLRRTAGGIALWDMFGTPAWRAQHCLAVNAPQIDHIMTIPWGKMKALEAYFTKHPGAGNGPDPYNVERHLDSLQKVRWLIGALGKQHNSHQWHVLIGSGFAGLDSYPGAGLYLTTSDMGKRIFEQARMTEAEYMNTLQPSLLEDAA